MIQDMHIIVMLVYNNFKDLYNKKTYYEAIKELIEAKLLLKTSKRGAYIVNVHFANKLFKPKFEI